MVLSFSDFLDAAQATPLAPHVPAFRAQLAQFEPQEHGDFARWMAALDSLPTVAVDSVHWDQDTVSAKAAAITSAQREQLEQGLRGLHPWRKGPFELLGVHIDTEWRSDWKWGRVLPHLASLQNRLVLDIGCGSGYHLWRMAGAGANCVVGIDPSLLFHLQYRATRRYLDSGQAQAAPPASVWHLPLGIEQLPAAMGVFDTVFSMGILYHRRSPLDHLLELRELLRPGGQLVLETLIIEGEAGQVLVPEGRYARMGNVWFLPSVETLLGWMRKLRFRNPRCVDINRTTTAEQRSTDWMQFQSLADFLDPNDATRSIEGYPGPVRAVVIAEV